MMVSSQSEDNLRHAGELVREAAEQGAQFAVLPEMFCCPYEKDSFGKNKEPAGGRIWKSLQKMAEENHIYLIGGTMPEEDGDRLYNTCFVFDPSGKQIARHRKVHLFDVDIPGGQRFFESHTFSAGNDITVTDTEYGTIGIEVCFDIRFEEISRLMALKGAQMIFVPANFNRTTGPKHWDLLFRSRALDNQLFEFGCSAAADEQASYVAYGHSIAVSPWGEELGCLDEGEEILFTEVDLKRNEEVRSQIPVLLHRRTDLYEVLEK